MNLLKYAKEKYKGKKGKRITLKQVNAAIEKEFPKVFLVKDNGYFFIASDDNETGLKLAGFYQTSIYVAKLTQLTIEQWVREVKLLMNNPKNV